MKRFFCLLSALVLAPAAFCAPLINEFVAENQHGLTDADGAYSDWIEIHNPDATPVNLSGWHLTDNAGVLNKWTFPSVTIAPGEYLVVFASGKDRAVAGQELHTNFSLSAEGEYLALVDPTGVNVVSAFSPAFPPQKDGYSYGASQDAQTTELVAGVTPTYLVPPSAAALAADWNQTDMANTAGWQAGTGPGSVGYETAAPPVNTGNIANQGIASQSTTLGAQYVAATGNNGNYGDFTHTLGTDTAPFWLLEFPADKEFTRIRLFNRTSCCGSRLRDITVKVLDAGNAPVFTSLLLNPENTGFSFPNGPAVLDLNLATLTGGPVTGRKIRIERAPDPDLSGSGGQGNADEANVLSLGEVEVHAVTGPGQAGERNLSLEPGNTASQSTTNGAFTADMAINNVLTDFTHTLGTDGASTWRLDLGQRRLLSKITLHNRTSCCGSRLRDITVRVKDQDNSTVTYTSPLLNPENTGYAFPNGPASLVVDLGDASGGYIVGRYIEVIRTADPDLSGTGGQGNTDEANVLSLAEVVTLGTDYGNFTPLIATDLKAAMHNTATSAFLRYAFTESAPATIHALRFRARYDDGFVAYLNGVKIAQRNAPETPAWNSAAVGGDREDGAAVNFEEIDVTAFKNALIAGTNVLAIHAMTSAPNDPDFLFQPQLVADRVIEQPIATYLRQPTPGAGNDSTWFHDFVADTNFTQKRGFYTFPQTVSILSATSGASIYYTTDGSDPTPQNGTLYTSPITVSQTTVLRARAFKQDWEPTNIDTQTYIFLADVIQQQPTGVPPPGWPTSPVFNSAGQQQAMNYGMDPTIRALYGDQALFDALTQIPTISIVTPQPNLTDPMTGIYTNAYGHGEEWERPASVEWLDAGSAPNQQGVFQEDCGVRIRGGFSRNPQFVKHSFRLYFRDSYGEGKLRFPIFGENGTDEHDVIDLASSQNYSWPTGSGQDTMLRDPFARQTLLATGSPACRNRYVHLYLNGIYWGLYYFDERPIAGYGEAYFGGSKDDYDAIKTGNHNQGFVTEATDGYLDTLPDGSPSAWRDLWNKHRAFATAPGITDSGNPDAAAYFAMLGRDANGVRNPNLPVLVDIDSLINYMLVIFYSGDGDAPLSNFLANDRANNWFAMKNRNNPNMGFVFFNHDAEHTFGAGSWQPNRTGPFYLGNHTNFAYSNPQWMFQDLAFSPEFRMRVADLAHKDFFNGGVMTTAVAQARFDAMAAQINLAVKAHSQRWGDAGRPGNPYTATDWQNAVSAARAILNGRESTVVQQLRDYRLTTSFAVGSAPLYPGIAAPSFSQAGGHVPSGTSITITAPSGSVYYTIDGSDPRAVGGAVSGNLYTGAVDLTQSAVTLKARAFNGTEWSALAEAVYFVDVVGPNPGNLVISKVHYHPSNPTPAEVAAGFLDDDDFEFLEFMNIGTGSVNLTGCYFSEGIEFTAPSAVLPPGGHYLIARNAAAFEMRYGFAPNATYRQNLGNNGDILTFKAPGGEVIRTFGYGVDRPWPSEPDGLGPCLVLKAPHSNPDHGNPANWRASATVIPAGSDASDYAAWKISHGVNADADDFDGDGINAFLEYALGGSPSENSRALLPRVTRSGGQFLFSFDRNLTADDVSFVVEGSDDLHTWFTVNTLPARTAASGIETLTFSFPLSEASKRFLRVRFRRD